MPETKVRQSVGQSPNPVKPRVPELDAVSVSGAYAFNHTRDSHTSLEKGNPSFIVNDSIVGPAGAALRTYDVSATRLLFCARLSFAGRPGWQPCFSPGTKAAAFPTNSCTSCR